MSRSRGGDTDDADESRLARLRRCTGWPRCPRTRAAPRASRPAAIARGDRWFVEIEAVEDLSELAASVRSWLRELGAAETCMRVDGRDVRVTASMFERRQNRASNENFIG